MDKLNKLDRLDEDEMEEEVSVETLLRLAECGLKDVTKQKIRSKVLEREMIRIIPDKFICGIKRLDGGIKFKRYESTMECAEMIFKTTEKWPTTPRIVISPPQSPNNHRIQELRVGEIGRRQLSPKLNRSGRMMPEIPERVVPPIDLTKITRIIANAHKPIRDSVSDVEDSMPSSDRMSRTNSSVSISYQQLKDDQDTFNEYALDKPVLSRNASEDSELFERMSRVERLERIDRMIRTKKRPFSFYQKDMKMKEFHLKTNMIVDQWTRTEYIFSNMNISYEVYMYLQRSMKGINDTDDEVQLVRVTLQTR